MNLKNLNPFNPYYFSVYKPWARPQELTKIKREREDRKRKHFRKVVRRYVLPHMMQQLFRKIELGDWTLQMMPMVMSAPTRVVTVTMRRDLLVILHGKSSRIEETRTEYMRAVCFILNKRGFVTECTPYGKSIEISIDHERSYNPETGEREIVRM